MLVYGLFVFSRSSAQKSLLQQTVKFPRRGEPGQFPLLFLFKCNEMLSAIFCIYICWAADLQLLDQGAPESPGTPHPTAQSPDIWGL